MRVLDLDGTLWAGICGVTFEDGEASPAQVEVLHSAPHRRIGVYGISTEME